jgi:drug/metabolite transporter (DMT)-like permease
MQRAANYLAGIGYATIFGFSFLMTKDALLALDPFELMFLRFALAALLMGGLAALGLLKVDFSRAAGARRGKGALRDLALACLFQPVLYFVAETYGVRDSASSTAGLVLGALPAAVSVAGAFMLHERLGKRQSAALLLSVAGVALIVLRGASATEGEGSLSGLLCLLGSLAAATFYNVFSRKASRAFSPAETTFAMMWTGAIVFGAVVALRSLASAAGPEGSSGGLLSRALPAWPGILYLGVLSSVLAFFLINFTLSRLKASQSIVFASLTTVVSVAAGVFIRGEAFGAAEIVGGLMIVLGVWGTNLAEGRRSAAGSGAR